jgi:predicted RNase H-like nuclease (RuvC/YqgF family)
MKRNIYVSLAFNDKKAATQFFKNYPNVEIKDTIAFVDGISRPSITDENGYISKIAKLEKYNRHLDCAFRDLDLTVSDLKEENKALNYRLEQIQKYFQNKHPEDKEYFFPNIESKIELEH